MEDDVNEKQTDNNNTQNHIETAMFPIDFCNHLWCVI